MTFYSIKPDRDRPAGWKIFEIADIPFYVQPFFLILLAVFAFPEAQAMHSLVPALLLGLIIFISLVAHEGGHALVSALFGLRPITVVLHGLGGYTSHRPATHGRSILIIAAGPLATALLWYLGRHLPRYLPDLRGYAASGYVFYYLAFLNRFWFFFNVLPIFPMDGGQTLFHLLSLGWREPRAMQVTAFVSLVVCALLGIWMYRTDNLGGGLNVIFLFMFVVQNFEILRNVRRL